MSGSGTCACVRPQKKKHRESCDQKSTSSNRDERDERSLQGYVGPDTLCQFNLPDRVVMRRNGGQERDVYCPEFLEEGWDNRQMKERVCVWIL